MGPPDTAGPRTLKRMSVRSKKYIKKKYTNMKWALKIAAKLLVARLPVPYAFWKSVGVFRHGRMDAADYPLKIFKLHLQRAYPQGLPPRSAILELGPGDSIASAVIACAIQPLTFTRRTCC